MGVNDGGLNYRGAAVMLYHRWIQAAVCLLLSASGFDASPPRHFRSTELHVFQALSGTLLHSEPQFYYLNQTDPNLVSLTLDLATDGSDVEMYVFLPNSSVPSQSEPSEWRSQASLRSLVQGTRC